MIPDFPNSIKIRLAPLKIFFATSWLNFYVNRANLFLYYKESLVASNLNSKRDYFGFIVSDLTANIHTYDKVTFTRGLLFWIAQKVQSRQFQKKIEDFKGVFFRRYGIHHIFKLLRQITIQEYFCVKTKLCKLSVLVSILPHWPRF